MNPEERQKEWADGYHTSSSGKREELSKLPSRYLGNIVNKYGEDHDVSAVQKEIDSRPAEEEK